MIGFSCPGFLKSLWGPSGGQIVVERLRAIAAFAGLALPCRRQVSV
jgi:hypothetical protein